MESLNPGSNQTPNAFPEIPTDAFPGFRRTDMQFNIGRLECGMARGVDIIDPKTHRRFLLTHPSSAEAERLLRARFEEVVFERTAEGSDTLPSGIEVFSVPEGARLLIKTLRQSPYEDLYMDKLANKVGKFLGRISRLDPGLFGVTLDSIAIGHNSGGEDDDVRFVVVPPLQAPDEVRPVSAEELSRVLPSEEYQMVDAFISGFHEVTNEFIQ